jgi:hypothetical protein
MLLLVDYYMPRVTPDNGGCAALAGDFIHAYELQSAQRLSTSLMINAVYTRIWDTTRSATNSI